MTGSHSANMQPGANPYQDIVCPDILAEIFTFCLPDVGRFEYISSRKAPLLLCSVCSSWHSLAISTPRLWQTFHFYTGVGKKLTIDSTESITLGIRTWLDRSRALPLSIRLETWTANFKSKDASKCRLVLEMLSQEVSRWESFELFEDGIWIRPTSLHLSNEPMSESSIDRIPLTAALRLKRLYLHSLPNYLTSVSATPWDQLVELNIRKTQMISMVVEVIRRCPRLESLGLHVEEGDDDGSLTFRSITQHDTLRRLRLCYVGAYINGVTDCLTLPALTDPALWSRLSMSEVQAKFCCSRLVDFFTRSHCGLQKFELRCLEVGFGPGELLECLSHRSCQTLTHLAIQQCDKSSPLMVERELLTRLTFSDVDDDVPLCPKLGHLNWIDCYRSDKSFPGLLGRMIQSRCFGRTQDTQLRSLLFHSRYSISKEDYELLQLAQNNGGLYLV